MALPQPTNVPRIIEVLDPGANQLSVEVRMPPQLASKYPDKAWGTAIDTIGLQKKDSDRFVGYVLVDIQPMRDSDDLKWIFEKLSGPVWTTTTVGSENIIPEKFRSQVSQTKTKQEVAPGTAASAITGDLISSTVEAQENTGKAVKVNVSETIDAAATALVSPSLEDQLYVTTEILVAEGTLPDTGTGVVESTVQAIGKGKAIKTSKFAVTAYTNKTTYTVGYASLLNENVGSADSIPAKFRALKSLKTWRLRVQAAAPPSTPALGVGSGAYSGYDIVERAVKQTQENGSTDVFELVIVGLANTGANSLDSTTYGKIVTTTTTETLSLTAQTIDTGLAVISSTVEELGNGMTLKSTEQVQGETWPDPVEQEVVSDGTKQPPARYLRDLIRTTVKKMVGAVGSTTLTGNQVAKSYKRETPDRVAETVTTEELNLTLTAIDSGVQQKPFVTITEVMTPGPAKVLPPNRSGSAKLVYENGATNIWENTEEVAVAREGSAGKDKDKKPFVEITTDKRYSTTDTIATASGSANIVFNDGTTQVYEVNEVTSTGRYGAAGTETDQKPFVKLQTVKTYEATDNLVDGQVGSTNKIYDDGTTEVYEKSVVNATAREGLKGIETSAQQWGAIKSTTNYTANSSAPAGGSVQIVFAQGATTVYEQTTTDPTVSGSSQDVDAQQWGKITWSGNYSVSAGGDKSRQVWSNGVTSVFLNETASLSISGGSTDVDPQQWGKITWDGSYSSSSSGDKSRQVYSGPGGSVFLNETALVAISGGSKDVDPQQWGSVTWNGSYASSSSGDKSRKLAQVGNTEVYLNEDATLTIIGDSFVSAREENSLLTEEQTTSYSAVPNQGVNSRSRVVFSLGQLRVYENITITRTAKASRTYQSVVNVDLPPVFESCPSYNVLRRDGEAQTLYTPFVTAGYRGPMACTVTEYWQQDPNTTVTPTVFRPSGMTFRFPGGGYSVEACLHPLHREDYVLTSSNPTYKAQTMYIQYAATEPTTWVGMNLLAHVDSQPYRDGFVIREYRVQL